MTAVAAAPATLDSLTAQLAAAGLVAGRSVLVHSSMRAVGPVDGGVSALLCAVRQVVGRAAVVVPTQTAYNSTSSPQFQAATDGLTAAEVARHVDRIEAFDPASTPSSGMGVLAERVRRDPAAVRSGHPQTSFAALGHGAVELMRVHDLDCHLGDRSPLGALYELDATVLLLGVDYAACTAFHLAEYRLPYQQFRGYSCFVRDGDRRVRRDFKGLDLDDGDFGRIGRALEQSADPLVTRGRVGYAVTRTMSVRRSVDFAVGWMTRNR
ncbi:aminoglycoside 3-N-acetyltransferase [Micromonospora phaseoli]|uniref:Aminoglycoside N(3)-acetyltransferase n=1 Tax=Micromonospora phaseoli TaxID=1144548 RepID=A0A1H6VF58_9ACTN|nr:AAC(3) family N-acetyltransferase [Micromonospora phaseoli]PZV93609.1 aminoglycoside 3-N-acetyltransferase [Micromonospora phaseoli]GIJ79837.1 AAC(3) family N-acetyltransferase [Micromonospora phaseoli]SEJ02436.1 aminoglycoside 3-N-acetyltransferase [Micromonospora phaseoli]